MMRILSQARPTRAAGLVLLGALRRPQPASFTSPFSSTLATPHAPARLPQRRLFSAGDIIEPLCQTAQDALLYLHSVTGLPWFVVIPIFSFGVNMLFRMPFIAHSQLIMERRSKLDTVLKGWTVRLWHEAAKERLPEDKVKKVVTKRFKTESKRLFALLGLQQWKMYLSFLGIPFWICNVVGLRRLSGATRTFSQTGSTVAGNPALGTAVGSGAMREPTATTSTTSLGIADGVDGLASVPEHLAVPAAELATDAASTLEPTLTTEGILWFTDLTAADPYYVLPVALTALTLTNIIPHDKAARRLIFPNLDIFLGKLAEKDTGKRPEDDTTAAAAASVAEQPEENWRVRLIRSFTLASPALVLLTGTFPAAVQLYIITSGSVTLASKVLFAKIASAQAKIKPCRRRESHLIRPKIGGTAAAGSKGE
jgi:mitochondrial inner membrane protein COX18